MTGTNGTHPAISVIVPTRNRAASLQSLLDSLDQQVPPPVSFEIVIADNGSTDDSPRLLSAWRTAGTRRTVVRVAEPGKARASNAAIAASRGEILAFLDDDVVAHPDWLLEVWRYFSERDCVAAQGSVLWPPEVERDPALYSLLDRYRTIVHLDLDEDAPRRTLTGANMAIRRHALAVVGVFREELGPGAAGLSEDVELSDRIQAHGGRIGCMARARVVHEIDRHRLTEEYFREYHERQGRSRYAYKHNGLLASILPNLAKATMHYVVYTASGNERRRYRAKGRYYHYREMLRLAIAGGSTRS